jgi:hypothetical protein
VPAVATICVFAAIHNNTGFILCAAVCTLWPASCVFWGNQAVHSQAHKKSVTFGTSDAHFRYLRVWLALIHAFPG